MQCFPFRALGDAYAAAWLCLATLLLAGCETTYNKNVTGTHGGLLPGMTRPEPFNQPDVTGAKPDSTTEVLPDGRLLYTQTLGKVVNARAWLTPQGVPQQIIFYEDGVTPAALEEYGPDGRLARVTRWFPGTNQVYWMEEYNGGAKPARKMTYWPNGNRRVLSEYALATPAGAVDRIQTWHENGRPKSLVQKLLVGDATPMTHGRQTNWDENGIIIYDMEYDHDVIVRDYLEGKARAPW